MGYVKARSMPSVSATMAHSLVCMPRDAVHIYKPNLQTAASLCRDTLFQWTHHYSWAAAMCWADSCPVLGSR